KQKFNNFEEGLKRPGSLAQEKFPHMSSPSYKFESFEWLNSVLNFAMTNTRKLLERDIERYNKLDDHKSQEAVDLKKSATDAMNKYHSSAAKIITRTEPHVKLDDLALALQ